MYSRASAERTPLEISERKAAMPRKQSSSSTMSASCSMVQPEALGALILQHLRIKAFNLKSGRMMVRGELSGRGIEGLSE